jgi:hypothetical protein
MTLELQHRLYELVMNPPSGSKIADAKEFGIDLTLNLRRLALTPTERSQEMESALNFMRDLQDAAAQLEQ